jgi:hypothetical protein
LRLYIGVGITHSHLVDVIYYVLYTTYTTLSSGF